MRWEELEMSAIIYTSCWFVWKKDSCAAKGVSKRMLTDNLDRRKTGEQGMIRKQEGETVS